VVWVIMFRNGVIVMVRISSVLQLARFRLWAGPGRILGAMFFESCLSIGGADMS